MLNSVGKKLFVAMALPALAIALLGLGWYWHAADLAVAQLMRLALPGGEAPKTELTQLFQGAARSLLIFSAVGSLATAVALRVFLSRPLRRLAQAMKRAEEGDFLARADDRGGDEIAALGGAFNRMLAKLTTLKAEEIDHQRDLEAARTELELKGKLEQTNAQLEGRVRELSILFEVARAITSTLDLGEVLQRISALVPQQLQVPKFSIMLLNAQGQLEVKAALPVGHGAGLTFELGEGICGRAALSRKSVYVPDLESEGAFKVRRTAGPRGRGCLLAVPMLQGTELLGVLNFERPEKADFAADEIEFFTAVTAQASMAVQNARLHAQTVELSITDPLTQVPNRRFLFQQLELEIARANRFATQLSFLMIDIDHFKRLNDSAGHQAGDAVLQEVCALMKGMVRRVDTLARYGGEEFVVLLPQVTREEALEVAQKLRQAVESAPIPYREVQPGGKITISVGVASLPADATERDRLVDCADSALYASKRNGRNKVNAFAPGMEVHPGRERGPHVRRRTGELPAVAAPKALG